MRRRLLPYNNLRRLWYFVDAFLNKLHFFRGNSSLRSSKEEEAACHNHLAPSPSSSLSALMGDTEGNPSLQSRGGNYQHGIIIMLKRTNNFCANLLSSPSSPTKKRSARVWILIFNFLPFTLAVAVEEIESTIEARRRTGRIGWSGRDTRGWAKVGQLSLFHFVSWMVVSGARLVPHETGVLVRNKV